MTSPSSTKSKLFEEYIGAMWNGVKFTDVPINPNVDFHFILSFAVDYNYSSPPTPSNGNFNIFWNSDDLGTSQVASVKKKCQNVKVALSLGGDTVDDIHAYFNPTSIDSWVKNAVSTLTKIITEYSLDGIDINYQHFKAGADPEIFAECIGRLLKALKQSRVISFASIAPFDNKLVQSHYQALWSKYAQLIDYVNFQFYAKDEKASKSQFLKYYHSQSSIYVGGKIIISLLSGGGGLSPKDGFFTACKELREQGKFHGIFIWCADDSKKNHELQGNGFRYEEEAQAMLASAE
ncbi:hypothetical protein ACHQM5_010758 [Ranunculus cassubicifolius]